MHYYWSNKVYYPLTHNKCPQPILDLYCEIHIINKKILIKLLNIYINTYVLLLLDGQYY